jgi:hypothetical protein
MELEFLIPFYGNPDYLLQAVDRIRALENTCWRLTIVEDAHPQGRVVEEKVHALGDDRIRYRRNERNLGVNANIHQCIQLAEWDYFVITGCDDLVLPNYGNAVAALLERHPDAALVQPHVEVIDEVGRQHFPLPDRIKSLIGPGGRREIVLRGQRGVTSLLHGNWLYTPAACLQRAAFQKAPFRPDIDAAHDLAFVIDVLLAGESLVAGTEVAFQYRRSRASHSSSSARNGQRFDQERRYFAEIRGELRRLGWHRARRAARLRATSRLNALTQLPSAMRANDRAAATLLLKHALGP